MTGIIYLYHFDTPYHHARHYLGWTCTELEQRAKRHLGGRGARLLEVITQHGITANIVRTWPAATRAEERRLKSHSSTRLCPICNPKGWANYARNIGGRACEEALNTP